MVRRELSPAAPTALEVVGSLAAAVLLSPVHDELGRLVDVRYEYANDGFAELVDRDAASLVGRQALELLTTVGDPGFFPAAREVLRTGAPHRVETTWLDPQGVRGWFEVHVAPFGDLVLALIRDVTRERQLPDLVALAGIHGDAVMSVGTDRRLRMWNRAAEQMYGWSEREVLGRSPAMLAPPGNREEQAAAIDRALAAQRVEAFRTVRCRRDGSTFPCEVAVAPVLDAEGRVVSTLSVHHDISAEMAIRDASPVAIVSLDLDRRVTAWNPAAERILGWSEAEVLHRPFPAVAPEDRDEFLARAADQLVGPTEGEVRYRHKDGHDVDARLSTNPLRAPDGRPVGVVGLIEDLTEHRNVEVERTERRVVAGALTSVRRGPDVRRTGTDLCAVATAIEDVDGAVLLRGGPDGTTVLGSHLTRGLEEAAGPPPAGTSRCSTGWLRRARGRPCSTTGPGRPAR